MENFENVNFFNIIFALFIALGIIIFAAYVIAMIIRKVKATCKAMVYLFNQNAFGTAVHGSILARLLRLYGNIIWKGVEKAYELATKRNTKRKN